MATAPGERPTVLDAHVHLWHRDDDHPIWVRAKIAALRKDADLGSLIRAAAPSTLAGVVVVQAAECEAETLDLLRLAVDEARIGAVVGWVDLTSPEAARTLDRFAAFEKFRGVRIQPVFDVDRDWMGDPGFREGLLELERRGLVLDLLLAPHQLDLAPRIQGLAPSLRIVLNHCGRPVLMTGSLDEWRQGIESIAEDSGAVVKLSGLIERAGFEWTTRRLAPAVEFLFERFGPERLAFASNWPMLELAGSYRGWVEAVSELFDEFGIGASARRAIWADNAAEVYRIAAPRSPARHGVPRR